MRHLILFTGCLWLVTLACPCSAREWHNISPLKTTRAEVLQLLGEPQCSQSDEREYFEVENQKVTIRWTRPDCYSESAFVDGRSAKLFLQIPDAQIDENAIIDGRLAGMDALVFQITVEPKLPLKSIDSVVSSEADKVSNAEVSGERNKAALKELYKSWLSQNISCISGDEDGGWCTIWDRQKGFGYSSSKAGVTALYYFPTDEELKAWSESHKPCLR